MLTYIRCGARLMAGPALLVHAKGHNGQQEKLGLLGGQGTFSEDFFRVGLIAVNTYLSGTYHTHTQETAFGPSGGDFSLDNPH